MSQNDTTRKYAEMINEFDLLIKAGKINDVTGRISSLNLAQVPRDFRQGLAKICRRAGLIGQGLKLLHPIIRNEKNLTEPARPGEICEYSVLLSRNGSIQEAANLLKGVDAVKTPEAWLYSAYCHISNWEYAEAVGFLEKYLLSTADDYSKMIARVNLTSAYAEIEQWEKAERMLCETIELALKAGAQRLVGNCYEIWGQVHLHKGDYSKSRQALDKALDIFGGNQSFDQLLIFKTQSFLLALESKSLEPLWFFRKGAEERRHWESVRDTDLFAVKIKFDQKILDQLYYGTPMKAYRERIQAVGAPSESFVVGSADGLTLDLQTGKMNQAVEFGSGKKIHQVLAALVKDAYVPRNLGTLFAELYPNEFFDINTSQSRVKQLLLRTRQWLKENQIPAEIEQSDGAYRFSILGKFGIQMSLGSPAVDPTLMKWYELKRIFAQGQPFSAEEACQNLNWSRSTFLRLTDWALEQGELRKSGIGKATRYSVSQMSPKKIFKPVA